MRGAVAVTAGGAVAPPGWATAACASPAEISGGRRPPSSPDAASRASGQTMAHVATAALGGDFLVNGGPVHRLKVKVVA